MPAVTAVRNGRIIEVKCPWWTVLHDASQGGCWTSITFAHGSGKNLLTGPASGRVRNLEAHPTSDASSPNFFDEKFEKHPRVEIEKAAAGVAVVAEGTLRLKDGDDIGVRYRHRYEYRDWGLVAHEIELIADVERRDIVEVVAFDLPLRPGMTDAYVRENPSISPHADLTGMGRWFRLGAGGATYSHRYVPMHVVVFERGVEGIEFSAPSDIHGWNTAVSPEPGMGYNYLGPSWDTPGGTLLSVGPYCVAYRRNPTTLKGATRLRWYTGLPFLRPKDEVFTPHFHVSTGSRWAADAAIERASAAGATLLRFHCDYRRDGPFWRDGMYPPFDASGMKELRRVVDAAHRCGMKAIPYISVKELHPETPECAANQEAWRQQPGPTFPELHTWAGTGEFGQLMCLESGWLDFRKASIETLLKDIPWDGLYFDWCTPHACRNPHHSGGTLHTDQDAFYDFMFWVRERVGPDGVILSHLSGLPQLVVENMSTALLIYEDQPYAAGFPEPPDFPVQCGMLPIAPHYLIGAPKAGTPQARTTIMSGILQGTFAACHVQDDSPSGKPGAPANWTEELLREAALVTGEGLESMKFLRATDCAVCAGEGSKVYGAVWHRKGRAVVYLGNFSAKPAKGRVRLDARILRDFGRSAKPLVVEEVLAPRPVPSLPPGGEGKGEGAGALNPPRTRKLCSVSLAALKSRGLPYSLKRWGSAVLRISVQA